MAWFFTECFVWDFSFFVSYVKSAMWNFVSRILIFDPPPFWVVGICISNLLGAHRICILPPFWRCWKIESLDFWNFFSVCVTNSTSRRNFMTLEWLEVPFKFWWPVNEWVSVRAIFSGPYLRIHLSYIIEIWYSLQDGLHNYMCIISALCLKWVPSCVGGLKLARNGLCLNLACARFALWLATAKSLANFINENKLNKLFNG